MVPRYDSQSFNNFNWYSYNYLSVIRDYSKSCKFSLLSVMTELIVEHGA